MFGLVMHFPRVGNLFELWTNFFTNASNTYRCNVLFFWQLCTCQTLHKRTHVIKLEVGNHKLFALGLVPDLGNA